MEKLSWADFVRLYPEAVVSGWLSHRTFVLNATKEVALAGLLATPRDSRRTS